MKNVILHILLLMFLICVSFFCVGCNKAAISPNIKEAITINLIADEYLIQNLNSVFEEFEMKNPYIRVSSYSLPLDEGYKRRKYISSLSSELSNYDIYSIPNTWASEFADKGFIFDIKKLIDIDVDSFTQYTKDMFMIDGNLYTLPIYNDIWVMYHKRNDVLPTDWKKDIKHLGLPSIEKDSSVDFILNYSLANGSIFDAVKLYKEWYDSLIYKESNDSIKDFTNGKINYLWAKSSSKDLIDNEYSLVQGKMSTTTKLNQIFYLDGVGLCVNARMDEKKKDAVKSFLEFMSSKETHISLSRNMSVLPVYNDLVNFHTVLDRVPFAKEVFSNPDKIVCLKSSVNDYQIKQEAKEMLQYFLKGGADIDIVCDAFNKIIN